MTTHSTIRRITLLLAIATIAAVLVACGGGGEDASPATPTPVPDPLLSEPSAALVASAERVTSAASVKVRFDWSVRRDSFNIAGYGTFETSTADVIALTAGYAGEGTIPTEFREKNDSQIEVLAQDVYLKTPSLGEEWVALTPADLGTDWDALQRLKARRSPVDYATLIAGLSGEAEDVGDETLGGRAYRHLRAPLDAATLTNALADIYGTQGQTMLANRFSGAVTLDVWLDPESLLPFRVIGGGQIQFENGDTLVSTRAEYSEWNTSFVISPPIDPVPLAELLAAQ